MYAWRVTAMPLGEKYAAGEQPYASAVNTYVVLVYSTVH